MLYIFFIKKKKKKKKGTCVKSNNHGCASWQVFASNDHLLLTVENTCIHLTTKLLNSHVFILGVWCSILYVCT